MNNPEGLWYPKQQPLQGMTGLWGGVSSALISGGGGGTVGSINGIPNGVAGQMLFGGWGFESWINPTTDFSWSSAGNNANQNESLDTGHSSSAFSFTVPADVEKIRVVLIGGGGGSSGQHNVFAGEGGGGIESYVAVTAGETLNMKVGKGGGGGNGTPGDGGTSKMFRPSHSTTQPILQAYGGRSTQWTHNRQNGTHRVAGDWGNAIASPLRISLTNGGSASGQGNGSTSSAAGDLMPLTGASYHGGGAGSGQANPQANVGKGLGFGGGGGSWQGGGNYAQGGTWGYTGNRGGGNNAGKGPNPGPVPGFSNPEGKWDNAAPQGSATSGGGGGSYGGSGCDGWNGGFGAGGLVRVWWADTEGNPTWIDTAGNYQ